MNETVSVIVPTYNYGRFIADALRGVLGQTRPADEVIVVDDGSTDETQSVVRGFDNVRYVRQENRGVGAARNLGVANSTGTLIAFADADDIWRPQKLERQIAQFAGDDEIGLVHCGLREFDDTTGETVKLHVEGAEGRVADHLLLWKKPGITGAGGTIMVRRKAFESAGGFDEGMSVGEDLDFCYRVAREYKIGFLPEVLVDYRAHSANAHRDVGAMEAGMSRFYAKAFAVDNDAVQDLRTAAFSNFYRILGASYLRTGQYAPFLRCAFHYAVLQFKLRGKGRRDGNSEMSS